MFYILYIPIPLIILAIYSKGKTKTRVIAGKLNTWSLFVMNNPYITFQKLYIWFVECDSCDR